MKLLLDTHLFLQTAMDKGLTERARSAFRDLDNELFFSAASYWEICIKLSIGKLALQPDWKERFERHMAVNGIGWLAIKTNHSRRIIDLPWVHRDPFDRLLVAQALEEGMVLLTGDRHIRQYTISTIW